MSLFGELDLENAADDPFAIPPGTYHATLTKVSQENPKDPAKRPGFVFEYTITNEDEDPEVEAASGLNISEWKTIPVPGDDSPEAKRNRAFIKQRLLSLGVAPDDLDTVGADDLVGTDVVLTVKKNGEYTNVTQVKLPVDDE